MLANRPFLSTCVMLITVLLAGCAKRDSSASDTLAAVDSSNAATPAAPALALADFAGRWNVTSTPTSGTARTPTTYVLNATSNATGWTITFPGRAPVPVQVSVAGDSIATVAGPYESVRRKGIQVTTTGGWRLNGDKLVGTTLAHYQVKTADSVLTLTSEGTRAK